MTTTAKDAQTFSVVGEGKVTVVPDTAYVDTGITVNAVATVDEAQLKINDVNNKIVKALGDLGLQKENITTSNYSIQPNTIWDNGKDKQNGFNGNVSISIKISNKELVAKVIDAVTKAGANQVQGTRFVVEDPQKAREEARQKAIDNAKADAQKLAKTLGISLGKITNIAEGSPSVAVPQYNKMMFAAAAGVGSAPQPEIEPGSQTITSVVTLYFEKN